MITLKEWMELADYRINEGWEYHWHCYGPNVQGLDSVTDEYSFSILFDRKDQTVYQVEVADYRNDRAYRMIHQGYQNAHQVEAEDKGVSYKQAWDSVNFVDLEVDDDFIQKCLAIKAGEDYDTRVEVPLELPEESLFELMKMAHERDVTLNQFVEELLRNAIDAELKV